ncbi:MAG: tetratricopeptide repeat protein [Bdellovibrionales bacterium]|nr:tetratricopeptide repeat protein [Bdellovibrionales bacterium]
MATQDPQELFEAAKEYFNEGHYKIVEPMIQQLMIIDDRNPEVHYMAGTLFFEKGKLKKAIHSFKRALEIDPTFADASIGLSIIYNDLGRYSEGKKVFEEAYARMKQKTSAGDDPYINEKIAQKHEELGDLYFLYKKYEDALENFNKASELSKNPVDYSLKAIDSLLQMKLHSRALREAEAAEKRSPNNVELLLKLGQIHYQLDNRDKADEYWERVLARDPDNMEAKNHLRHSQQEIYIRP